MCGDWVSHTLQMSNEIPLKFCGGAENPPRVPQSRRFPESGESFLPHPQVFLLLLDLSCETLALKKTSGLNSVSAHTYCMQPVWSGQKNSLLTAAKLSAFTVCSHWHLLVALLTG